MAVDPRFHGAPHPQDLAAVVAAAGGHVAAGTDTTRRFAGAAPLHSAGPDEVSFLDNRRYLPALRGSRAGAVILHPDLAAEVPPGSVAILAAQTYLGWCRVLRLFHPPPAPVASIHPTAAIAADASLGAGCEIGPYAVVESGAELGAGCVLGPHAVVGRGVVLGPGCRIGAHASISHAIAGREVVLHPGARVGQEGFGFAVTPTGGFETVPQLGRVLLGDHVEIGANSCVDRGSAQDTVLGPGTRLDNLVQIGHNVRTGRGCVLVAQVGISGSTLLGDFVTLGGQAGVVGHVSIGDGARISAQAGVSKDVPARQDWAGSPARPEREYKRTIVQLRRLGR
ncbi:UDP-3-O-(3-hydroxymyristoyl)glucosamine N-acyltransferase [Roseomonas sp. NAR14]|uniref:UDP-3-O-acylglucosamine N-acyltransferase n=1 Tax=Roseomonas acroporae TaxID=2937791 RepID=A0A9X1YAG4_9PROT|nr:UDP-3-O-(3-hydroxymyristoyl)glucosamine N-acyltransferase [Roseomonas acroporae]